MNPDVLCVSGIGDELALIIKQASAADAVGPVDCA